MVTSSSHQRTRLVYARLLIGHLLLVGILLTGNTLRHCTFCSGLAGAEEWPETWIATFLEGEPAMYEVCIQIYLRVRKHARANGVA